MTDVRMAPTQLLEKGSEADPNLLDGIASAGAS